MPKVIAIHSFRNGTGKSQVAANLSTLLAIEGAYVGVIDADLQSPQLDTLFGLTEQEMACSFNQFILGRCALQDAAHDVTARLDATFNGKLYVIPASTSSDQISDAVNTGLDARALAGNFRDLMNALQLDILLLDTSAGLRPETLPLIAISDSAVILMRLEEQDFQGTGVTLDVMHRLEVPQVALVINMVSAAYDSAQVKSQVEQTYNCEVAGVLPLVDGIGGYRKANLFALHHSEHPFTTKLRHLGERLLR